MRSLETGPALTYTQPHARAASLCERLYGEQALDSLARESIRINLFDPSVTTIPIARGAGGTPQG